jgi:hypothetical protein
MSVHMGRVVVALIGSLAVAACASNGASREDAVFLPADSVSLPADSVPLPRPAPKSSALQSTAPQDVWRHLPEPVSIQQFNQDKAKCTRMGNSTPGAGSPEMKFYLVFSNCMRSIGYEPPGSRAVPRPASPPADANENRNRLNTYAHATT